MSGLYYKIAGHVFRITTPDAKKTEELLPTFSEFKTVPSDNLLFRFSGGETVVIPEGMEEEEVFDLEDVLKSRGYKNPSGERVVSLQFNDKTHFVRISADCREYVSDLTLVDLREGQYLNVFLKLAFILSSAPLKTIKMHASATEKEGNALLFLGVSGTGKSTHSTLWRKYVEGCTLLNDDEPIVRILADGSIRVYGAPWSGGTPCYRNTSAEVSAFVHLRQSPENKLTKLSGMQAFASMFTSTHSMRTDTKMTDDIFNTLADILERKSVYRLDCRPDREAVSLTEQLM